MGRVVGAAIVSHVPPLVLPESARRELNDGEDTTLVAGLHQLRAERSDRVEADTIVVIDTHSYSTIEFPVAAHERRSGCYVSVELPRGRASMPDDPPDDPDLARTWSAGADGRDDSWITTVDEPHLPIHHLTTNLPTFVQGDERWVSASVCRTAEPDDFLPVGRLLGEAVAALDRNVVILANGGLRASADRAVAVAPVDEFDGEDERDGEGELGVAIFAASVGVADCTTTGTQFGEYEAVAGTGQTHIRFDL